MQHVSNYSYSITAIFSGLLMVWSPIKIGFNVENMKKSSVETEHLLLLSARLQNALFLHEHTHTHTSLLNVILLYLNEFVLCKYSFQKNKGMGHQYFCLACPDITKAQ